MSEPNKLETVNLVLRSFARRSTIVFDKQHWCVEWESSGGTVRRRRWMTRGQDFFPVWNRRWEGGGTACTALSQLIRWLQGKPVLPLSSWEYWASDTCKLLPHSSVVLLGDAGYPISVNCVLCHKPIVGGLDWWSLDGVTGPCCGWTSGCRQKQKE